ncbi:MAG TPA: GH1 family beta-glucosidase [Rhodothermales bacterium]|nr:GH1 family beta-glucosidase [Rhodothermales bacterium]
MPSSYSFPDTFLWGVATSSYQIEGSPLADGAKPSIWHRFDHSPGHVANGDTGEVACDHYNRYQEDVDLMHWLGVDAYRFSIAWSRILPDGTGMVNNQGVDFYDRLVDALLEKGIQPFATLYHWDLPAALDDRGGWLNPDSTDWFSEYAQVMYRTLGDRVKYWSTHNEPWVVMDCGYLNGTMAPGHRNVYEAPLVTHNLLRAHAAAVQAYRAEGDGQIGIVVNLEPKYAASDEPEDQAAQARAHAYMNRQFLDPIFLGSYPDELVESFGDAWPDVAPGDMDFIQQPIDFLGINYYSRSVTRHDPSEPLFQTARVRQDRHVHTDMDWEVYPQALTDVLMWIHERYDNPCPLYITENGAAFYDPPTANGSVQDPLRVAYFREHLRAAHRAIEQGVDLRGYFAWSLLDNFEWSYGYDKRFGIIHVDFETQERTPKASAHFYAEVIESNGAALGKRERLVGSG